MTGRSAARRIERGLRTALLAVFVVGVRRRNPGAVVNAAVAAVGTFLPGLVERTTDVELRPWHRVYVSTAMVTHAIGMLGPYDDVPWWDHLTHTHSATILGGAVFAACRRFDRDPNGPVVFVVVGLGVLWEILEYGIHAGAKRLGIEPLLVSYGARDTALDLVFDAVGAALVLVFGDRVLRDVVADE